MNDSRRAAHTVLEGNERRGSITTDTRRIRSLFAGVLLLAVMVPAMAFVLANSRTAERESSALADEIGERVGERTADNVDQFLQPARQSVRSIALLASDSDARSDLEALERALTTQLAASPSVNGLFIAFPDGSFRFISRSSEGFVLKRIDAEPSRSVSLVDVTDTLEHGVSVDDPDDRFDPTIRPWYLDASQASGLIWTDPYVFFSSQNPGVTAAEAIRDGAGSVVAVVGADIEVAGLSTFLSGLPLDDSAEAFIVSEGGEVVGAPPGYDTASPGGDGRLELSMASEFGLAIEQRDVGKGFFSATELPSQPSPAWTVIVRADHVDFVDVVGRQRQWVWTLVASTALATVLLALVLAFRVTRPVVDLERRAKTDSLTGLANRAALYDEGARLVRESVERGESVAVALCDVDAFKAINDRMGHLAGDEVLRSVARAMAMRVHPDDLLARFGGDEFVVVAGVRGRVHASELLDRILRSATESVQRDTEVAGAGMTIGATLTDGRDVTLEELLGEADRALRDTKRTDKGSLAWAQPEVLTPV